MSSTQPTAIVDQNAVLGDYIEMRPFCTVGSNVKQVNGCKLISHVVIDGDTDIGSENIFFPFCIIGPEPQDMKYQQEKNGLYIGNVNVFRESASVHRGTVTGIGETRIGNDNLIMGYVHIACDCVLGNNNIIANYVGLSGHVTINDHVTVGGQSGVVQFLRIGSYAYIGGASTIYKNIPPYASGYRNLIQIKGVTIVGLKRAGFPQKTISAIADAHKLYFRSDLSETEALRRIEAEFGDFQEVLIFTKFLQSVGGSSSLKTHQHSLFYFICSVIYSCFFRKHAFYMASNLNTVPQPDRSLIEKHSFSKEELLDCGNGLLFGPGRAHLPVGEMLMLDRIVEITEDGGINGKGKIIAELDVNPDLWFFKCHFIGDPVMPGCLGLDALWQLVGFFLAWKGNWGLGRALGCGKVKFSGQVLPDAKLVRYEIDITKLREGKTVMGIANCTVSVDGNQIYEAKEVKVGLFTSLDDF